MPPKEDNSIINEEEIKDLISNSVTASISTSSLPINSISSSSINYCYTPTTWSTISSGTLGTINSVYTTDDIFHPSYNNLSKFLSYLPINEIACVWEKIKNQILDKEEKENFLSEIIKIGVFPEDFIMENIEYLEKDDIFRCHKNLINSGAYKELKLYYELKK